MKKNSWKKLPCIGIQTKGCLNCGPLFPTLNLKCDLAVGFGDTTVTCDGTALYREIEVPDGKWWTGRDAEKMAARDPNHDWRIDFHAPLYDAVYQRQAKNKWVLVEKGMGFA